MLQIEYPTASLSLDYPGKTFLPPRTRLWYEAKQSVQRMIAMGGTTLPSHPQEMVAAADSTTMSSRQELVAAAGGTALTSRRQGLVAAADGQQIPENFANDVNCSAAYSNNSEVILKNKGATNYESNINTVCTEIHDCDREARVSESFEAMATKDPNQIPHIVGHLQNSRKRTIHELYNLSLQRSYIDSRIKELMLAFNENNLMNRYTYDDESLELLVKNIKEDQRKQSSDRVHDAMLAKIRHPKLKKQPS